MENTTITRKHGIKMLYPAKDWREALPCGNGPFAALVYGSISPETIVFNHDALWYDAHFSNLPNISDQLPKLRKLLAEGNFEEANKLYPEKLAKSGYHPILPQMHPAFDLKVKMPTSHAFMDYSRSLDFSTGQVSVAWKDGKKEYKRQFFISRPDNVAVMRVTSKSSDKINAGFQLCERNLFDALTEDGYPVKNPFTFVSSVQNNEIEMKVHGSDGGDYAGVLRVFATGGTVTCGRDTSWTEQMTAVPYFRGVDFGTHACINVADADEILVVMALDVNKPEKECLKNCKNTLNGLSLDYDVLFARHCEEHKSLFEAMRFELETDQDRNSSNEHLLLDSYKGNTSSVLIEKMFDFGRYLLLSCSGRDGYPPTLQGSWNGDYCPPWRSIYVHNENTEMFYWQALPGNMAKTTEPYFNYFESFKNDYRENAKRLWGCRGIFVPLTQTTHTGLNQDGQSHVINFTGTAAWISQLFYDYWLFTRDEDFLRNRAIPFMKEVAHFYEDFILADDEGYNLFMPSDSPENAPSNSFPEGLDFSKVMNPGIPITINSTIDAAVTKDLFKNLSHSCEFLGIEQESVKRWQEILDKMRPYRINDDGALAEWINPAHTDNYAHRHISHLYPVFPGFEITKETEPDLFEACKVALEKRLLIGLESQTGWSLVHIANIYARLGMAEAALECLDTMVRSCVGQNLFAYHNDWRNMGVTLKLIFGRSAPFQVDASMGYTSAVLEMLFFSTPEKIKIMPALPKTWKKGKICGLQCRNGTGMDMSWNMDHALIELTIKAKADTVTLLQFPKAVESVSCDSTDAISDSDIGKEFKVLTLSKDAQINLKVKLTK